MNRLDNWLEDIRLEEERQERERRWLQKLETCACTRSIPDRSYLKSPLCRKCSRWIATLTRRRRCA